MLIVQGAPRTVLGVSRMPQSKKTLPEQTTNEILKIYNCERF
jgi:hypothetical protein